jgi:hypothetical protein
MSALLQLGEAETSIGDLIADIQAANDSVLQQRTLI